MSAPTLTVVPGRAHDLPPLWDGRRVGWREWAKGPVFVCGPRSLERTEPPCPACSSTKQRWRAAGVLAARPGATVSGWQDVPSKRQPGRTWRRQTTEPERSRMRLMAFRCPDCAHDTVLDIETDEVWELDETDYGDDGSADPRLWGTNGPDPAGTPEER